MGMGMGNLKSDNVHGVISVVVRRWFNDIQDLRVQLQDWEGGYAEYADSLWSNGRIWSGLVPT